MNDLNILSCSAKDLCEYLLSERFDNNEMECAAFLLECAASLPDSGKISEQFMQDVGHNGKERSQVAEVTSASKKTEEKSFGSRENSPSCEGIGDPVYWGEDDKGPVPFQNEISCIQPRAKFVVSIREHGLCFENSKDPSERIEVPAAALHKSSHAVTSRRIIVFPKPEQCKSPKEPSNNGKAKKSPELIRLVLIPLQPNAVTFRNKPLTQLCFPLPVGQKEQPQDSPDGPREQDWILQLAKSFTAKTMTDQQGHRPIIVDIPYPQLRASSSTSNPCSFRFQSDGPSTNPSMPFVSCYNGVHMGSLFPLEDGLLFYKPPLFFPRDTLHSIACGRGNSGSGATRYVDMHLLIDPANDGEEPEPVEFTNISRDELTPLKHYIDHVLTPAMAQDAAAAGEVASTGDEDSGDTNPLDADDEGTPQRGARRQSRRRAAMEASETTRRQMMALESRNVQAADEDGNNQYDDEESDDDVDYEAANAAESNESSEDEETSEDEGEGEGDFVDEDETESEDDDNEKGKGFSVGAKSRKKLRTK